MRVFAFAMLLCIPSLGAAQTPAPSSDPISQSIRAAWAAAKRNIVESAEQMPEADYAFKPVDTVRSFGAILAHVAGANYVLCGPARNDTKTYEEDSFEKTAKTKANIVKALNESIAYCDAAYDALTDKTAGEMISGNTARAQRLISNAGHLQEHYGNLVTYFRIKGMVPPSSRRQ
jgi:DinB family protein